MTTFYKVGFAYNAGYLSNEIIFNTEEEAMTFVKDYEKNFCDCGKYIEVNKYTKKGFFKRYYEVEKIYTWKEQ